MIHSPFSSLHLTIQLTSVYKSSPLQFMIRTLYFFKLNNDQLGCLYLNDEYINRGELIISILYCFILFLVINRPNYLGLFVCYFMSCDIAVIGRQFIISHHCGKKPCHDSRVLT